MKQTSDFAVFMRRALAETGARSGPDLARFLGISRQAFNSAKLRNSIPDSWLTTLRHKGIDADKLLRPEDGHTAAAEAEGLARAVIHSAQGGCASMLLPPGASPFGVVHGSSEAGGRHQASFWYSPPLILPWLTEGNEIAFSQPRTAHAFERDWLARRGEWTKVVALEVTGEDMLPEIAPGNMVFLDTSQRQPVHGETYAIGVDRTLLLRRLGIHQGKPMFMPARQDAADPLPLDTVVVVGKILFSCRGVR
ncbi:S24 family peptidase [Desulfocurvibacter africanus]|uniref:S24 family peptidase n=1 Tax=Desulfocurvibacter africanus TaxID=873 RepID=UPI00041E88DE|nr:S24 family peptidase [Desulfocurvibacter africanus]